MRETSITENENMVDIATLAKIIKSDERDAEFIAEKAGAVVNAQSCKLYDVKKVEAYLDERA